MSTSSAMTFVLSLGDEPLLIALALAAATFILEDAATIAGAALAAAGVIRPEYALLALGMGIVLGDLGLYCLGRLAATRSSVARLLPRIGLPEFRLAKGRAFLQRRLSLAVLGARAIPGLRLPTYVAAGYLRASFPRFAVLASGAGAVWTGLLFGSVLLIGITAVERLGLWHGIIAVIVMGIVGVTCALGLAKHALMRARAGRAARPLPERAQS